MNVLSCVPVAIGQIMAYHRKNDLYKNYYAYSGLGVYFSKRYNWANIHNTDLVNETTTTTDISDFLYDISMFVNTTYGSPWDGGSSTYKYEAVIYFRNAGYTTSGFIDYNYQTVINELKAGRPVYLRANRSRWLWGIFSFMYYNGHAWVCDGYRVVDKYTYIETRKIGGKYSDQVLSKTTTTKVSTTKYLHMNWGWGGKEEDGWCTYDYWVPTKTKKFTNYQYNKEMLIVKP